jgi:TRAP-type C4-dicarboxylate transport system permease small subunit
MSTQPGRRKPFTPTLVVVVGLLVGIAGLVMTILGIGGVSVTHLSISNTVDIQTASGGVIAMVVGFGMAVIIVVQAMRVDAARAKRSGATADADTYAGLVLRSRRWWPF